MFKKKIDLSALINKNDQENKETSNSDVITSSLSEKNINIEPIIVENPQNIEIEKSDENDVKIEIKPTKKIWIKKNNIVIDEIKEELINEWVKKIELKPEKEEEELISNEVITTTVELSEENNADSEKNKEDKKIETPEELEKRYEEMTSKIEIKKEEVEYNKDNNSDLFWNYKSDFEELGENWEKKKEDITTDEKTTIKNKNNKKIVKIIIFLLLISIIWSWTYFFNDIKKIFIKEKTPIIIDEPISTETGIIDTIDPEIKEEVNDYIEQIKQDNSELAPKEIKKKINEKIIEIYLKKAMTK